MPFVSNLLGSLISGLSRPLGGITRRVMVQCYSCPLNGIIRRPETGQPICRDCFFDAFESEAHEMVVRTLYFHVQATWTNVRVEVLQQVYVFKNQVVH